MRVVAVTQVSRGMARPDSRVADCQVVAGCVEDASEFAAPVSKDPLKRPSGCLVDDASQGVRAGCVAGGNLPDFIDALETADVERVDASELTRTAGLDMSLLPSSLLQLPTSAFGEQSGPAGGMLFEDECPASSIFPC